MSKKQHVKTGRQVSRNQRAVKNLNPCVRYSRPKFDPVANAMAEAEKQDEAILKEVKKQAKEAQKVEAEKAKKKAAKKSSKTSKEKESKPQAKTRKKI